MQVLAVAAGFPASYHAVWAHVLREGHEGADATLTAFPILHGHRRVPSDWLIFPDGF